MQFQGFVFGETYSRDACASYLADHLDDALELIDKLAAFALGPNQQTITDDTIEHDGAWIMGGDAIVSRFAEIRTYVHDLKTLELALTTKISQARVWAERVQRYDPRLDRVAGLMLAGTHAFIDAGARQSDTTEDDFNQCDPALGYLQSRGMIDGGIVSLDQVGALVPGYMFQVWGGVSLYDLAEMMNTFLGAADVHYSLYVPDENTVADVEAVAEVAEETEVEAITADDAELSSDEDVNADIEVAAEPPKADDVTSDEDDNSLAGPVHVMGAIKSDTDTETLGTK